MPYKIIVLAPSAGGKSTLMRYLREHSSLVVAETDEEVMRANNNIWPDDELKNKVLVPETTDEILSREAVIYLASYIPDKLLVKARGLGFKIVLLHIDMQSLQDRNMQRMSVENYQDATPWLQMQLDTFERLKSTGLIDEVIDGTQTTEELATYISKLADQSSKLRHKSQLH